MRLGWYSAICCWTDEREMGIEVWRHVTMVAKFLSPQSLLTETAITFDQRWKNSTGHRFVPEFNHE